MSTQQWAYAPVEGANLRYEYTGEGNDCVVLVHGFSMDARMWDDQVRVLGQSGRVLRYDMRGFGGSDVPVDAYAHAEDLRALLDNLGIDRASVVGLSMGGMVAAQFALAHPDRTRALVLAGATVDGAEWSTEWLESWGRVENAAATDGLEAAKAIWLGLPIFAPAMRRPQVASALRAMVDDYSGWHWTEDDPAVYPRPSTARRLRRIGCPTLAVVGELDAPDFHAQARLFAERIPHARVSHIPGAGHLTNMEEPEAFSTALRLFLDDVRQR